MFIARLLLVSIFTLHCVRYAFSEDQSEFELEKEWIPAAQGAIWDSSELFERILVGTSEIEKGGKKPKITSIGLVESFRNSGCGRDAILNSLSFPSS